MDEQGHHRVGTYGGLGLGVAAMFLPYVFPKIPAAITWTGFAAGCAIFVWGSWPLLGAAWPQRWSRMMPLHDAARIALEASQGTVLEMMARRPANAPQGPLCFMATKLFTSPGVTVYGKHVPSSMLLPIKDDLLFANEFAKDATIAWDQHTKEVTYTDLQVKRSEALAAIEGWKAKGQPA